MNQREQMLVIITVFVLLFGVSAANVRKRIDLISSKRTAIATLKSTLSLQKELINSSSLWRERYNAVKDQMPIFEPDRQVATYWLNIMDLAAERYGIRIRNRRAGSETLISDVYEFPIEVRDWEGTLESFIKFLYAMQSEGAMLSVRDVTISPVPNRQGILKGTFTLYCAYMRGSAPADGSDSAEGNVHTEDTVLPETEPYNPNQNIAAGEAESGTVPERETAGTRTGGMESDLPNDSTHTVGTPAKSHSPTQTAPGTSNILGNARNSQTEIK